MRWRAIMLAAGLAGGGCVPGAAGDADLERLFKEYLEELLRSRPLTATQLGDHRYNDRLDDLTAAARGRQVEFLERTLGRLRQEIERNRLSAAGEIDRAIFEGELVRALWLEANTNPWAEDPRVYGSYLTDSVYLLFTQSTQPLEVNVGHALARLNQTPSVLAAARANLTRPPQTHTETAIRQNRGAVAFYEGLLGELAAGSPRQGELVAAGREQAKRLRDYQDFLEREVLPRSDGEWRLGPERFARKLELVLESGMGADVVLAEAKAEYERVRNEMYVISRQLWSRHFPGRTLPPDDAAGRQQTMAEVLRAVGREHGEVANLTRDVGAIVADLKAFISERDFLRLPDPDQCAIIEMPEFQRGNSTAYLNPAPPLDPLGGSYYAVSPPPADWPAERVQSYLEEYNQHMLQILSIHEAYPGHYVQLEYANRHPSLIRKILSSGPYVEGWAVYTEQVMLDEGYGGGDLRLRLNQLKFYLRAVINAILDHGMHCEQMSEDEAMALLVEGGFQSEGEARLKVIRAKQSSAQLSTYFVGRMAFVRLRRQVQRELGDAFSLGRFHEAVLTQGSVPVKFLPDLLRGK